MSQYQPDLFEVKIDFETGSEKASRVFKSMADMIDAINMIDKGLIGSFAIDIRSNLVLEDIQTGSLKACLRNILSAVDDDVLKELDWKKLIGSFLVKGKYRILKYLEDKKEISNISQVKEIENEILLLAKQSNIQLLPIYTPVNSQKLLEGISYLYNATNSLLPHDFASFISVEGEVTINKEFSINAQAIEELLTKEIIVSNADVMLRIKKPDFLSSSMWDVQYEGRIVQVKILDFEWLNKFQSRSVDVRPGDSIRAYIEVINRYDHDGRIINVRYNVLKVHELIKVQSWYQNNIFDEDNLE